eukprot:SAG31_NODE_9714_length_1238_cov_1.309921_1_plen_77_part_00
MVELLLIRSTVYVGVASGIQYSTVIPVLSTLRGGIRESCLQVRGTHIYVQLHVVKLGGIRDELSWVGGTASSRRYR